jgi:hypothetical protein
MHLSVFARQVRTAVWFIVLLPFNGSAQATSPKGGETFSAVGQFSAASNPNGAWSYGNTQTLGGPFNLFTTGGPCCAPDDRFGWYGSFGYPGYPLVFTNSYLVIVGLLDLRAGASGEFSVVRWTAPSKGRFDVLGSFVAIQDCLNGTPYANVQVLRNGSSVFHADLICQYQAPVFHFAGKFEAGDTVDFAVGLGADGFHGEAVGLQANITPITEPF